MSVIAIKGIPLKWSLMNVVKILAKTINGHFEALNFQTGGKTKGLKYKICYLRLSEKLDPVRVVERINSTIFPKGFRPFASVPDYIPDIPLAAKPKRISNKMRRTLKLPDDTTPDEVVTLTANEILDELQLKYPELYNISKKMGHKLLDELAKIIEERLTVIVEGNAEVKEACFKLSQSYRRAHPHFGDFQLVLSTLHALQDAAGTPRTQIQEKELAALPPHPYMIDNLPFDKVQQACNKYSERIIKKVSEHIKNLKSEVTETDTEDEIVRKKVREELKKIEPFLPMIVRQVVSKHFIPQKNKFYRVRVYGEPFLPSKETMTPFVRRYQPTRVIRSNRMFNMLRFNVPPSHYASLMAMDGTVLNGAKLVIRSSELPRYKISQAAVAGGEEPSSDAMDTDQQEDWNELEM